MKQRSTFGSKLGTLAVVGGSAVGLGNIWKFPYVAGNNGGGAFVIIYIVICFVIALPLMMSEFAIGRSTRSNPIGAVKKLTPQKGWTLMGYASIIASLMILPFYSVIAGWSLEFLKDSLVGGFAGKSAADVALMFEGFVSSGWQPIWWMLGFLVVCCLIVALGIEKGIERYSKVLMPLLVVMLVALAVYSSTLDGFRQSAEFLFKPDFSKIDGPAVVHALGQAFFSMSLGMGSMITYGSYIKKQDKLSTIAGTVAVADVVIALLAGMAIFPAVFSFGISPTSGPDLVFITLPTLFGQMAWGSVISVVFFVLLLFAAMTSVFSMLEVIILYFIEEFHVSRPVASGGAFVIIAGLGILCALSQVPGSSLTVGGQSWFDIFDNLSANIVLPLGGLTTILFAGWVMKKNVLRDQFTENGAYGLKSYSLLKFLIKFVIPVAIAVMFLSLAGLIRW